LLLQTPVEAVAIAVIVHTPIATTVITVVPIVPFHTDTAVPVM
jgi:hypothetical protein